jgi:hypothetical protein
MSGVRRVAPFAKRWLLGTQQGAADSAHVTGYSNELMFRFNRRRSRNHGMVY